SKDVPRTPTSSNPEILKSSLATYLQFRDPPGNERVASELAQTNETRRRLIELERHRNGAGIGECGANGGDRGLPAPHSLPLLRVERQIDRELARKAKRKRAHLQHDRSDGLHRTEIDHDFFAAVLRCSRSPRRFDDAVGEP